MPQVVTGTLSAFNGVKFLCTFTIKDADGTEYEHTYSGVWEPSVPDFTVPKLQLEYNNRDQLNAAHEISGHVGKDDVVLTIKNGPKLTGSLLHEVDVEIAVKGNGAWDKN
ncbi:unnamed protein product [Peniophora sp. CBMAI 1063]|nr:unnamed protein product [Peniophora sp. CBMAI 1063]